MTNEWYYTAGGAQQGPVSEEELKRMMETGGLESGAMVWRQGMAEWLAPGAVPELTGGAVAPAMGGGAHPAAQSQIPVGGMGQQQAAFAPAKKSGMAIGSLICSIAGLVSCCVWCIGLPVSIVGVVLGHIHSSNLKKNPQEFGGEGLAKAGLIVGYIGIALSAAMLVLGLMGNSQSGQDMLEEWVREMEQMEEVQIDDELVVPVPDAPEDAAPAEDGE